MLSRRWRQRRFVKETALFIVDELHLIGQVLPVSNCLDWSNSSCNSCAPAHSILQGCYHGLHIWRLPVRPVSLGVIIIELPPHSGTARPWRW